MLRTLQREYFYEYFPLFNLPNLVSALTFYLCSKFCRSMLVYFGEIFGGFILLCIALQLTCLNEVLQYFVQDS